LSPRMEALEVKDTNMADKLKKVVEVVSNEVMPTPENENVMISKTLEKALLAEETFLSDKMINLMMDDLKKWSSGGGE
ncbi:MAG: hypothetical protein LE178_06380, partial [Endomicrobium sp.]|nr:hypothetical protein [Endomicrobium sp.]